MTASGSRGARPGRRSGPTNPWYAGPRSLTNFKSQRELDASSGPARAAVRVRASRSPSRRGGVFRALQRPNRNASGTRIERRGGGSGSPTARNLPTSDERAPPSPLERSEDRYEDPLARDVPAPEPRRVSPEPDQQGTRDEAPGEVRCDEQLQEAHPAPRTRCERGRECPVADVRGADHDDDAVREAVPARERDGEDQDGHPDGDPGETVDPEKSLDPNRRRARGRRVSRHGGCLGSSRGPAAARDGARDRHPPRGKGTQHRPHDVPTRSLLRDAPDKPRTIEDRTRPRGSAIVAF